MMPSAAIVPEPLWALLVEARDLGFLGPGPVDLHVGNAVGFAAAVDQAGPSVLIPGRALDLGSGGGMPGLVLAACWPTCRLTLLDGNERRTAFLAKAVTVLELEERVVVVRSRAEELGRDPGHRAGYDLVVARSFGQPGNTAECAAPFLRVGGALVTSEPPPASSSDGGDDGDAAASGRPDRWPTLGLAQVGLAPLHPAVRPVTVDLPVAPSSVAAEPGRVASPGDANLESNAQAEPSAQPGRDVQLGRREATFHFHVAEQRVPCPDRYPRRTGVPAKRPLF